MRNLWKLFCPITDEIHPCLGLKDQVIELLASDELKLSWFERFTRFVGTNSKTSKPPSEESGQRSSSAYNYLEPIEDLPDTNFCVSHHRVDENLIPIYIVF